MQSKYKTLSLLAVGAVLTGGSVAFSEYIGFIEWFSMIPLCIALRMLTSEESLKLRRAYAYGLFYFELFYAVSFHWFIDLYPMDFTGLSNLASATVVFIACFGLSFLQALFGGLVFVIFIAVSRLDAIKKRTWIMGIYLPILYTFYEFTQTLGWWGVPWARLSLAQSEYIFPAMAASLFGSYIVTAVVVAVNSLIAEAILSREEKRSSRIFASAALLVFTLNISVGVLLHAKAERLAIEAPLTEIGLIQGNWSSSEKWTAEVYDILNSHIELTRAAADDGAKVVIWAETALPIYFSEYAPYRSDISDIARDSCIDILVGTIVIEDAREYNAILHFRPDGSISERVYYKQRPVPFGEFVPMRSFIEAVFPLLAEISILSSDTTPGDKSIVFDTEYGNIGSLICFDSIYENLARESVIEGAEILAISTNDSWFSDSQGIYMHNNQARLRAIENGRYAVRAANTGLTSVISNSGKIIDSLPLATEGYIVASIPLMNYETLYYHIGNLFVYSCGILSLFPLAFKVTLFIKKHKKQPVM